MFQRGAQSLVISASILKSFLARRMVHPCLPISPETIILSPGFANAPEVFTPSTILPTPVVVIKILSTCPLPATLVSPATISTPAFLAVSPMDLAIFSSSSTGKPSSIIYEHVRYLGLAPIHAISFTVPQMASLPIFPPGNS